eukprot:5741947-Pyramimonas_sp.AAC.1
MVPLATTREQEKDGSVRARATCIAWIAFTFKRVYFVHISLLLLHGRNCGCRYQEQHPFAHGVLAPFDGQMGNTQR